MISPVGVNWQAGRGCARAQSIQLREIGGRSNPKAEGGAGRYLWNCDCQTTTWWSQDLCIAAKGKVPQPAELGRFKWIQCQDEPALAGSKTELADPASMERRLSGFAGAAEAQRTGHIFRATLSAWRSGKADSGCCAGDLAAKAVIQLVSCG